MPAIGLGVAVLPPIYLLLGELTRHRFRRHRRRGGGACTRRAVEQTGRQHPRRGSVVTSSANHPPTKTTRSRRYTPTRFHPRTAVVNFASTLSGMAMGLRDVAAIDDTITAEAEELAASLASGVAQHPEADQDAAGRRGEHITTFRTRHRGTDTTSQTPPSTIPRHRCLQPGSNNRIIPRDHHSGTPNPTRACWSGGPAPS
jgi:hypothetical protein